MYRTDYISNRINFVKAKKLRNSLKNILTLNLSRLKSDNEIFKNRLEILDKILNFYKNEEKEKC